VCVQKVPLLLQSPNIELPTLRQMSCQQSTIAVAHCPVCGCETDDVQSTNCEHNKDDGDDSGNDMVTTPAGTPQSRLGVDVTPKAHSATSSTPAVQEFNADTKAVDASGLTFPPGSNKKFCVITLRYGDYGSSHSCHVVPRCTKNNIELVRFPQYCHKTFTQHHLDEQT